jgi:hypothetical protein
MKNPETTVVFTPGNEPYLGRELLFHFDQTICACLEQNARVAPHSRRIALSDLQKAACQLIPQGISIALSIRELIRLGYLFGALTLVRPIAERAAILLYLNKLPSEISKWNRGWQHSEAPCFSKMLEVIASQDLKDSGFKGHKATAMLNAILHGKPDCAVWSLIPLEGEEFGHGVSKILSNPVLCDEICGQTLPWLICIQCMMGAYFPEAEAA